MGVIIIVFVRPSSAAKKMTLIIVFAQRAYHLEQEGACEEPPVLYYIYTYY